MLRTPSWKPWCIRCGLCRNNNLERQSGIVFKEGVPASNRGVGGGTTGYRYVWGSIRVHVLRWRCVSEVCARPLLGSPPLPTSAQTRHGPARWRMLAPRPAPAPALEARSGLTPRCHSRPVTFHRGMLAAGASACHTRPALSAENMPRTFLTYASQKPQPTRRQDPRGPGRWPCRARVSSHPS